MMESYFGVSPVEVALRYELAQAKMELEYYKRKEGISAHSVMDAPDIVDLREKLPEIRLSEYAWVSSRYAPNNLGRHVVGKFRSQKDGYGFSYFVSDRAEEHSKNEQINILAMLHERLVKSMMADVSE